MKVGVVGHNFREDRAFEVKVRSGIDGIPSIEGTYQNLEALRKLDDPSGLHYKIRREGREYILEREIPDRLARYEPVATIQLKAA